MTSVSHDDRLDVWVRDRTYDGRSAAELPRFMVSLNVRPSDVVLDVGGHIGMFSRLCLKRGATVTVIEPDPDNVGMIWRNVAGFDDRCQVIEAAATDDPQLLASGRATLYRRGITHTGLHTLVRTPRHDPARVLDVDVVSFRETLGRRAYTVLKVDIEGGEWSLDWTDLPRELRAIHVEMHMMPTQANGRVHAPVVHQTLLDQGFTMTRVFNPRKMWGTHPVYRRYDLTEG